jgi:hypothetical protein
LSDLREALAITALASLEWSEVRERAIDRVAASGKASPLGVSLWKARYMLESRAYHDAIKGLIQRYLDRYKREDGNMARIIVEQAISEYLAPFCVDCHGAREMVIQDLKVTCQTCHGSGVRRYTDYDRARLMKLSLERVRNLSRKMQWLTDEMGTMDRAVNLVLNAELERN